MRRLRALAFVLSGAAWWGLLAEVGPSGFAMAGTLVSTPEKPVDQAEAESGTRPRSGPGATISGQARMTDVCSPTISPAVVYLEREDDRGSESANAGAVVAGPSASPAALTLVNQRGLQFVPRVQAIEVGRTLRFTNDDSETHNVHVVSPGFDFNQSMAPGQPRDFIPERPGLVKLTCDIHIHMRGYVIVSPTPWFQICNRGSDFRFEGVPDGRYTLVAWHEMGDPERREVVVEGGRSVELPPITLTASPQIMGPSGRQLAPGLFATVVRPWADVIDRISILLASSLNEASRPEAAGLSRARRLAEDSYWGEFEASDMETAVRKYLGFGRAGEIENQFRAIRSMAKDVAEGKQAPAEMASLNKALLLSLVAAAGDLNRRGVIDGGHLDIAAASAADGANGLLGAGEDVNPSVLVQTLKRGFHRVQLLADQSGNAENAASQVTEVYLTDFEPLERYFLGRRPQAVKPFEIRFNALRGEVAEGLTGDALAARISALQADVESLVSELEAQPAGAFGPAFGASLVTILREGIEVILLLAMLIALVSKSASSHAAEAGRISGSSARSRGLRAIAWGVGGAVVASLATAIGLNYVISSSQGQMREVLEGLVMLVAAGVLFYVSYWLVSQVEAKRWMDFLKRRAKQSAELGGLGTLSLTAFLAVYREGAETALMYQALIGSQGSSQSGLLGLAAGFGLGLVLLTIVAFLIRASSVRLPLRAFFRISGFLLFAMAIVFAGNGVFALQVAGILETTPVDSIGAGLPILGLHPNMQVLAIQGLLLGGAVFAWVLLWIPRADADADAGGEIDGSSGEVDAAKADLSTRLSGSSDRPLSTSTDVKVGSADVQAGSRSAAGAGIGL
jgi:high-affinity iron transporter